MQEDLTPTMFLPATICQDLHDDYYAILRLEQEYLLANYCDLDHLLHIFYTPIDEAKLQ
jgi:hypothetical protein